MNPLDPTSPSNAFKTLTEQSPAAVEYLAYGLIGFFVLFFGMVLIDIIQDWRKNK